MLLKLQPDAEVLTVAMNRQYCLCFNFECNNGVVRAMLRAVKQNCDLEGTATL